MFERVSVASLTVVASDKCISVISPKFAVDKLLRLFQCNVHVAVDRLQFSCELDEHTVINYNGEANEPLYTTPELSFTVTGAPMISLRKPDGSFASPAPFGA